MPNTAEDTMLTRPLVALLLLLVPALAHAQSEAALREYFEGRNVKVRIAMPGTEDGVDIYPGTAKPLDYPRHASRLKNFGTALRAGDEALVTKVKLKAKLIEFQLDGGGYGTMGDETSSNVSVSSAPKTKREQNLEAELKREQDPVKRRAMKEELDDLKAQREREDAPATAPASPMPIAANDPAPGPRPEFVEGVLIRYTMTSN